MQLLGKSVLMVVVDGVEADEVNGLKKGFEEEGALVLLTTPQPYITVTAKIGGTRTCELVMDLPFEAVDHYEFEGLLLPDGLAEVSDLADQLIRLIRQFHSGNRPVFASGSAERLLREGDVLSHSVVVREGTAFEGFLAQAVEVLNDYAPYSARYRPTAAS